jgi:hypothetical protein
MTDPVNAGGLVNNETALERETELISERFPELSRDEIDQRLHANFDQLDETATIKSHLVTVAGSELTNELLAEGATFTAPTVADEPDDTDATAE